jgi:hypothetical protein
MPSHKSYRGIALAREAAVANASDGDQDTLSIIGVLCRVDEELREAVAHALGFGHAVPHAAAPAHGAAGKHLH